MTKQHPKLRHRLRRRLVPAIALLTGLGTVLVPTAPPAHAVEGDGSSPFASYNMGGSDNGMRWRSDVERLAVNNQVVALQEAGSALPARTRPLDADTYEQIHVDRSRPSLPDTVQRVTWRVGAAGTGGSDRNAYFLQTDPQREHATNTDYWAGGRVNLAMVTDTRADEVRVLDNDTYDPDPGAPNNAYRARPLLGLRFGDTWYWNTHARGGDVPALLRRVRDVQAQDGRNWIMVGDFNLNIRNRSDAEARGSLHLNSDEDLVRSHQATFYGSGQSELDYAIAHGVPNLHADVPQGRSSDHTPVLFGQTLAPELPAGNSHDARTVLVAQNGRHLQQGPNGTFTLGEPRFDQNDTYQMQTTTALEHVLRMQSLSGAAAPRAAAQCPAVEPNRRRDGTAAIVAADCADPRAQWSVTNPRPVEPNGDDQPPNNDTGGPQRWRNAAFPDLCLTAGDDSVTAEPCSGAPNQRWWDNPTDVPEWEQTFDNVRLDSDWLGGRLRRSGKVAGTGVYETPPPPKTWWIYWLLYERQDYGWSIERLSAGDNVVRIHSEDGDAWCLGSKDEHATDDTPAVLQTCDDDRGVAGAGQRWLAETYPDGAVRFRNEANHLCLLGPDGDRGNAELSPCSSIPAQRWNLVRP